MAPIVKMVLDPWSRASYICYCRQISNELLRSGYKWVSRFAMSCIPTLWTGERWVEQMSRLHGTMC